MEEYGPTQTLNFQRCPTYWRYEKTWEEKKPWQPYKSLGTAMAVGLAHYFEHPNEIEKSLNLINMKFKSEFQEQEKWTLEALIELLTKGFVKVTETTGREILDNETIRCTEWPLGHARLDLVSLRDTTLIVTDHKVSLKLESRYIQDRLSEIYSSWQLYDYAWRIFSGLPLYSGQLKIRIHLIVFSPKVEAFLESKLVTSQELEDWHNGAVDHWINMERLKNTPFDKLPMSWFNCKTKYGQCPAFIACHSLNRDEKAMENFYNKKENKNELLRA